MGPTISYRIRVDPADLSGFTVEMRVQVTGNTVRIAMASHPEYDDRYWRYIENLTAESHGAALKVTHEEDALWRIDDAAGAELIVRYRIHLPPQTASIRAAWKPFLSQTGGLIGDLHSFTYVVGAESAPARVTLDLPSGWAIASGLDATNDPNTLAASSGELLLDSPIVIGQFQRWDFVVSGVPHHVVYLTQPNATTFDTASFIAGVQKLVSEARKIFGRPPYRSYTFLYQDGAQGALEHLNSVTIGARSQNLAQGLTGVFDTTAHEYFHTWNLMHVRPVERVGVRYRPAEPTGELWWSEGVTIYFSDMLLRRAQLPTFDPTRVVHLEHYMAVYLATPGYSRISAERVSRAAEDPFGLGDDSVSTHLQGNLLGTMLDLMIRQTTHGQRSLDDVMRKLSERFTPQRGINGRDIERTVHEICRCDAHTFFEAYVRGARAIEFDRYLNMIGLRAQVTWAPALNSDGKPEPDLRIFAFSPSGDSSLRLRLTNPTSVWGRAGLHTGDRVVSVDGHPIATSTDFRSWLGKIHLGDTARLEVMRNGVVSTLAVQITGYDRPTVKIDEIADATVEQRSLRERWLAATP
ncbi:MAG TPA: PDZ domain-containing protein [Pyrinomonadaceae bacterium]|nr:PDZ domain-containing protein [Pyrinomonadaceae bacterium]